MKTMIQIKSIHSFRLFSSVCL